MMPNVPCCSSAGIYLPCGYTLQHVYSSCIYIIYIFIYFYLPTSSGSRGIDSRGKRLKKRGWPSAPAPRNLALFSAARRRFSCAWARRP